MAKSTIYCSKCGKGNIIENPSDGFRFRCINCNELNLVQAKKASEESISKRLREVYQRSQVQSSSNTNASTAQAQNRLNNFRHKKTLVDKNIDLLEKVESMERETLEIKNEYLEMTHQLSQQESANVGKEQLQEIKTEISKVSEIGNKFSTIDEIKEMLLNIQTEPPKAIDFSELKSFFQSEVKADIAKLLQASSSLHTLEEIKELIVDKEKTTSSTDWKDTLAKEFKTLQHVINTIAGEVRVLRKEVEDVAKKLGSSSVNIGNTIGIQANEMKSMPIPDKTTQILAVDANEESKDGARSPSLAKKGSKSFKAVSEKLKSLKL